MICKGCGKTIPSTLLQRNSFTCPTCGKAYRRNASSAQSTAPQSRRPESPALGRSASKPLLSGSAPKWLVALLAALLVVLLVVCVVLLANRNSGSVFKLAGTYKTENLAVGKHENVIIEIPEQSNANYVVFTESDQIGIVCSVYKKTTTSFHLVIRNLYTDKRNPSITWGLIPYTPAK